MKPVLVAPDDVASPIVAVGGEGHRRPFWHVVLGGRVDRAENFELASIGVPIFAFDKPDADAGDRIAEGEIGRR